MIRPLFGGELDLLGWELDLLGWELDLLGGELLPPPQPPLDETLIKFNTHWSSNWSSFSHKSIFTLNGYAHTN